MIIIRIWDIEPKRLCKQHLLAQWREGLAIWSILTNNKQGYRNHPEVKRWVNNTNGLWLKLYATRQEMLNRNWNPKPMPRPRSKDYDNYEELKRWQSIKKQIELLKAKKCLCKVR